MARQARAPGPARLSGECAIEDSTRCLLCGCDGLRGRCVDGHFRSLCPGNQLRHIFQDRSKATVLCLDLLEDRLPLGGNRLAGLIDRRLPFARSPPRSGRRLPVRRSSPSGTPSPPWRSGQSHPRTSPYLSTNFRTSGLSVALLTARSTWYVASMGKRDHCCHPLRYAGSCEALLPPGRGPRVGRRKRG